MADQQGPSKNLGTFVEVVERSFFNKSRAAGWMDGGSGVPKSREDVLELVTRGDIRQSSFVF